MYIADTRAESADAVAKWARSSLLSSLLFSFRMNAADSYRAIATIATLIECHFTISSISLRMVVARQRDRADL